ncbi:alpha/beta fold hydrolase [Sphingopyxis sp. MWB1]|uniref:alpha/beta fold hydrolase n=1 Tax=Sphingopyxis sp. MWB1 TaxID=1537715 RepID=UPI00051A646B|nr:alpha/beta hydrolase [Sphingopyxis sp. MWB1]
MTLLLWLVGALLIALLLLYSLFPDRLVALMRALLRVRGGMRRRMVSVDGRSWPYLEGGNPAKPTLLLVHGFGADKDHWPMIARYLKHDYHLIAPDLPGFGDNERSTTIAYDIAAQTARLKAFVDALGLKRPHIAGNSMGGWIALRYALDYPAGLGALILLDSAGVRGEGQSLLEELAADESYNPLVLANLEDAERLVALVVHKPPYMLPRLKPAFYAKALRYRDQLDHIFWIIARENRDQPLNDRLGEVRAPTLILWGRHDQVIDASCVPVLEQGIANSQSHIFEDVGHVPMIEAPRATAGAMHAFLAAL